MGYIAPNSTIVLFKNIPFDPGYNDTMYFYNAQDGSFDETAQRYWFFNMGRPYKTYSNQSYTRKSRGVIRLEEEIGNVYDCNYMAFKNTSFENKWFYAFITNVEYVNNLTVQITYELDVIQTWMPGVEFNECFIERQHSETDNPGDNLISEPLPCTEYVYQELANIYYKSYLIIVTTYDLHHLVLSIPFEIVEGFNQHDDNRMVSGCHYYKFDMESQVDVALAMALLNALGNLDKADEIVCLICVPGDLWDDDAGELHTYNNPSSFTYLNETYVPRNKKLLTFPFSGFSVMNNEGKEKIYRFEYFDTSPVFTAWVNKNPLSSMLLIPQDYRGKHYNTNEIISQSQCPQCSWRNDQYLAWLAQNFLGSSRSDYQQAEPLGIPETTETALSTNVERGLGPNIPSQEGMAFSEISGLEGAAGAALGAALAATEVALARITAPPVEIMGNMNNVARYQFDGFRFRPAYKFIRPEYLTKYDSFFDMYGYAMNKVGIPNLHARPSYTYIKTIGCSVHGYLPASYARIIEKIMDHGIRFWDSNVSAFGSFSVNNSPASNTPNNGGE